MNDDTPRRQSARHQQAAAWSERGEACPRCGVRPDVTCQHRPGIGAAPEREEIVDKRKPISGGGRYRAFPNGKGLNFRKGRK